MEQIASLRRLGLFDARVPRYTSYPTAPIFTSSVGAGFQAECLAMLRPDEPVSVYVHIPFCERLCWFCACRTQGTQTLAPVASYLRALKAELALLRATAPPGLRMGRLHWGGGTPTILPPPMIHDLAQALKAALPPAEEWEFSVEIDPTAVDAAKIEALQAEGMSRASIGIQDFADDVQRAIGRSQSFETTESCVRMLREAGVRSLNADLVYGLPRQTVERLRDSLDLTLSLGPDRIALFGYAHVPHMSKRQQLIDEEALPGDVERYRLFEEAASRLRRAGFRSVGIDHFARPDDALARAADSGGLRRNFQGYTTDACRTLIGVGASSISSFEGGYVQNAAATAAYMQRIEAGGLAGFRGHRHLGDDRLRGRAIEMLMCDFRIDLDGLRAAFGPDADALAPVHRAAAEAFAPFVAVRPGEVAVLPEGRPLVRMIAAEYDSYRSVPAAYSKAS
jgi:oxygen-independent coproporphyrinogen III oxidase